MTKFQRPSGTVNHGNLYENLNVANIVLNLVNEEKIRNFYVSSNDASFGAFDDIVVEIETEQGKQTYAMQLKHASKSTLSVQQLKQQGNFSVSKYFRSVQGLKHSSEKFILYTNLKLNVNAGVRFQLEGENFEVELLKLPQTDAFRISDHTDYYYQFQIVGECTESKRLARYKKFFEIFFLYDDQETHDALSISLREKFKEQFLVGDAEFEQYYKIITEWCLQTGQIEKCDKKWMQRTIALQILAPKIKPLSFGAVTGQMKILREAIDAFNVTVVEPDSYDNIKVLWGDAKKELEDEQATKRLTRKYHLGASSLDGFGDLDSKIWSTLLWLMDKCPLIVTDDETVSKAIQLCPEEKFILLGQGSSDLKKSSVFKSLSDLKLHNDLYDAVVKNLICSVQGKEKKTVENLVQDNLEFLTLVKTDHLLEMLKGPYNLGGGKEELPDPYISRCLLETVIDQKFLEKTGKDNLIILDGVHGIDEMRSKYKHHHFINVDECVKEEDKKEVNYALHNIIRTSLLEHSNLSSTIYYSKGRCHWSKFQKICNKHATIPNFHQLRVRDDGNLQWIRSKGDLSDLDHHKLPDLCPIEEEALWASEPENKINVILADPGMGKTELMKSLKNSSLSKFWTVIIHPKDVYSFFKTSPDYNYADNFDRFLLDQKYSTMKERDRALLQTYMERNKVIYVWDAIDETHNNNLETALNIILEYSQRDRIQWVTSRCHLKKHLETKLGVLSKKLNQFGQDEQVFYIEKRLIGISSETIEEVIRKIQSTFVLVEHKDILGIPLQIFMLTELFIRNRDKYFGLLTNAFTLSDLYRHFIEEKFNIYYAEKMGIDYQSIHLELLVKTFQRDMTESYETVALKTVFSDEIVQRLNVNCERDMQRIQQGYASIGLVTEFPNQIPRFVHISFAEYFVAEYISKNLTLKETLADVIFDCKFVNVRFFLDLMLANKSPPHVAVLYRNFGLLKDYEDDIPTSKDDGGRSVLHLACSWGQRHPRLRVRFFSKAGRYNIHDDVPVSLAAETEDYWRMLDYLLEKCSVTEEDHLFAMTPLSYAHKGECLAAEIKILKKQGVNLLKIDEETEVSHAINILYYSARFGYDEAFDLFAPCTTECAKMLPFFNTINVSGRSLLYMACRNGHLGIVESLVASGAKINFAFRDIATPLIVAARNGYLEVVRFLLSSDAHVNRQNYMGATPLFMASLNGHYGIVELLVARNADANLSNNDGNGPLFVASFSGHLQIVKFLVQSGSDVALVNTDGATALFIACQVGHLDIVEFLVQAGAKVNSVNKKGASPLFIASQNGHDEIVEFLIAHEADVNRPTNQGATSLLVACQNGHHQLARSLVASGADLNLAMVDGATPLFVSCQHGHYDIVAFLIASGVCVAEDRDNASLLVACYNGHYKIVKLLVRSGADLNHSDSKGVTPLVLASYNGHDKIVDFLVDSVSTSASQNHVGTALHVACHEGHYKLLQSLLASIDDVNAVNENGVTSLFLAAQNGHERIVDLLLATGAHSNLATKQGVTPLIVASQNGHFNVVKSLVKSNGNVNIGSQDGVTPLLIACQNGYENIAKLLYTSGADLNCALYDGTTPLIAACRTGNFRISQLLIALGADLNLSNKSGNTPLFAALSGGHNAIVRLLVKARAELNLPNNKGFTPLFLASMMGNKDVVDILIESGGCVNSTTNIGANALFAACQNGHMEVVKSLVAANAEINLGSVALLNAGRKINKNTLLLFVKGHQQIAEFLIEKDVRVNLGWNARNEPLSELLRYSEDASESILDTISVNSTTDPICTNICTLL